MNNITSVTKVFEGTGVEIIVNENGEPEFELFSSGIALGQADNKNGKLYPKKARIEQNIKNADIKPILRNGERYLTEEMLYDLMLEVKTDKVRPFRKWVTGEVLPSIRKTGGYVNNDDLFINTYLPYADEITKTLFKGTLETVRNQNILIKTQQEEIVNKNNIIVLKDNEIKYKEDVITGLSEEITLAEKRQVLNRVVRYGNVNYRDRWKELYRQFEMKHHLDVNRRMENYNEKHRPQIKVKLDYIDKIMNMIPELYEVAVKLYENDVNNIVDELYKLHN